MPRAGTPASSRAAAPVPPAAKAVPLSQLEEIAAFRGYDGGVAALSPDQALAVTAVLQAVRLIGQGVAQMPFVLRGAATESGRSTRPEMPDHPVARVFGRRPNFWQSPMEFVEGAVMCAALTGDFVALRVHDGRDRLTELLPVVPGAWGVERDRAGELHYHVQFAQGPVRRYRRSEVFHLRGPSLDGFKGASPLRLARLAFGLASSLERQQDRTARTGGRPSGVLSFKETLTKETKDRLVAQWTEKFGPNGDGGIAVLDGEAAFKAMTMTAVDTQHIETRRFQIEEAARAMGVFPQMLMADPGQRPDEYVNRFHLTHTLGPWADRLASAIGAQLLTIAEVERGVRAEFDSRGLLVASLEDRAKWAATMLGEGGQPAIMTQNELRAWFGLDPVKDPAADVLAGVRGGDARQDAATEGRAK